MSTSSATTDQHPRIHGIREVWRRQWGNVSALLLAIAALATAWSSYQASTWGGIQSSQYNRAGGMRTLATRATDEAARSRFVDIFLFAKWLEAANERNDRLTRLYERHFRKEFRPAFAAWRASGVDSMAGTTPLERAEYRLQRALDAQRLDSTATRLFEEGQRANDLSDRYVFVTVILATVLFFAGAVRPLVAERTQGIVLILATLLCLWAIVRLALTPVAR